MVICVTQRESNMSGIIHFASGKQLEITEVEFRNISPKLSGKGIKVQRTMAGHFLPLNSISRQNQNHLFRGLGISII